MGSSGITIHYWGPGAWDLFRNVFGRKADCSECRINHGGGDLGGCGIYEYELMYDKYKAGKALVKVFPDFFYSRDGVFIRPGLPENVVPKANEIYRTVLMDILCAKKEKGGPYENMEFEIPDIDPTGIDLPKPKVTKCLDYCRYKFDKD